MVGLREKTMCFPYFCLPPIHLEAVRGTFSVLAARKIPLEVEMPAASTQKPHCGRYKWIGGKTVPAWTRLALLLGKAGFCAASLVQYKYHWVLTVHRNALKRVRSVPPGTQHTQKRLETCAASTEEVVGPGPSYGLVLVKELIISYLRNCLGLPVIPKNPISNGLPGG